MREIADKTAVSLSYLAEIRELLSAVIRNRLRLDILFTRDATRSENSALCVPLVFLRERGSNVTPRLLSGLAMLMPQFTVNQDRPTSNGSSRSWRWMTITRADRAPFPWAAANFYSRNAALWSAISRYECDRRHVERELGTRLRFSSRQTEQKNRRNENDAHRPIRILMSVNELTMFRGRVIAGIARTRLRWRSLRSGL